jgi:hypothetical protein
MTPDEEASVEAFAKEVVSQVRPRGTNAAVTIVILATARAAAKIAARTETGAVDREAAGRIFRAAVQQMSGFKP